MLLFDLEDYIADGLYGVENVQASSQNWNDMLVTARATRDAFKKAIIEYRLSKMYIHLDHEGDADVLNALDDELINRWKTVDEEFNILSGSVLDPIDYSDGGSILEGAYTHRITLSLDQGDFTGVDSKSIVAWPVAEYTGSTNISVNSILGFEDSSLYKAWECGIIENGGNDRFQSGYLKIEKKTEAALNYIEVTRYGDPALTPGNERPMIINNWSRRTLNVTLSDYDSRWETVLSEIETYNKQILDIQSSIDETEYELAMTMQDTTLDPAQKDAIIAKLENEKAALSDAKQDIENQLKTQRIKAQCILEVAYSNVFSLDGTTIKYELRDRDTWQEGAQNDPNGKAYYRSYDERYSLPPTDVLSQGRVAISGEKVYWRKQDWQRYQESVKDMLHTWKKILAVYDGIAGIIGNGDVPPAAPLNGYGDAYTYVGAP